MQASSFTNEAYGLLSRADPWGARQFEPTSAEEEEPLLAKQRQWEQNHVDRKTYLIAVLKASLGPFLSFTIFSALFAFLWHVVPWLVGGLFMVLFLLCLGGSVLSLLRDRVDRAYGLAVLGSATLAAAMQGYFNYQVNGYSFWAYKERQEYSDVAPNDPAGGVADAAALYFTAESSPDKRFASSFGTGSNTYCAAPITAGEAVIPDAVQYWAVGLDCCGTRGFRCDDTLVDGAHAGLVVYNRTHAFTEWMGDDFYRYEQAVGMSVARYGLRAADGHIFVRWVENPDSARFAFLGATALLWLKASLQSLPISILLALGAPAAARNARETVASKAQLIPGSPLP